MSRRNPNWQFNQHKPLPPNAGVGQYTKCSKCGKPITKDEAELNGGLCNRCWKRQELISEIYLDELKAKKGG